MKKFNFYILIFFFCISNIYCKSLEFGLKKSFYSRTVSFDEEDNPNITVIRPGAFEQTIFSLSDPWGRWIRPLKYRPKDGFGFFVNYFFKSIQQGNLKLGIGNSLERYSISGDSNGVWSTQSDEFQVTYDINFTNGNSYLLARLFDKIDLGLGVGYFNTRYKSKMELTKTGYTIVDDSKAVFKYNKSFLYPLFTFGVFVPVYGGVNFIVDYKQSLGGMNGFEYSPLSLGISYAMDIGNKKAKLTEEKTEKTTPPEESKKPIIVKKEKLEKEKSWWEAGIKYPDIFGDFMSFEMPNTYPQIWVRFPNGRLSGRGVVDSAFPEVGIIKISLSNSVEDDGIGFFLSKFYSEKFGLISIKSSIEIAEGKFTTDGPGSSQYKTYYNEKDTLLNINFSIQYYPIKEIGFGLGYGLFRYNYETWYTPVNFTPLEISEPYKISGWRGYPFYTGNLRTSITKNTVLGLESWSSFDLKNLEVYSDIFVTLSYKFGIKK